MSVKRKKRTPKTKVRFFRMAANADRWIHFAVLLLGIIGIVISTSASMGLANGDNRALLITVIKQTVFFIGGLMAMNFCASAFKMNFFRSGTYLWTILATGVALLACLLFPNDLDTRAWIPLGFGSLTMSIQPSEFAKITSILIVAGFLGDMKTKKRKSAWDLLKKPVAIIVVYLLIIWLLQNDFGSALMIFLITCVCLLIPQNIGLRRFQIGLRILFYLVVAFSIYILSPLGESLIEKMTFLQDYQINRFFSFMDPFADVYGTSYQLVRGLTSYAIGGWLGVGLGNSVQKYSNFPAASTDYILAILVEETGYLGFLIMMVIYCVLIFRLLYYAIKIHSEKGRIILTGTAMYFIFHMFFNIGGVTGMMPLTGIPLLLVSAGGSSTVSCMMCVGISQAVISLYRGGKLK